MDFPCGGGRGLRSNIRRLFLTVGTNCGCWRDQVDEVGARFCVDSFIRVCWGVERALVEKKWI